MTDASTTHTSTIDTHADRPVVTRDDLRGVRTARIVGFFIDYAIVLLVSAPIALLVAVLGIPTLGLAWGLFPFIVPAVAIVYLAKTMGGAAQATVGMRMMGVKIYRLDGRPVDPLLAGLHGVLYWFIHVVGVMIALVVTFFSSKKRLLHDIVLGTYVARG